MTTPAISRAPRLPRDVAARLDRCGAVALLADIDSHRDDPPVSIPVIAPERMVDFRREWRRRAGLRKLIRAAGRLDEKHVERSRVARGLWEMAHSREWGADGRGLLCDIPDFRRAFPVETFPYDPWREE